MAWEIYEKRKENYTENLRLKTLVAMKNSSKTEKKGLAQFSPNGAAAHAMGCLLQGEGGLVKVISRGWASQRTLPQSPTGIFNPKGANALMKQGAGGEADADISDDDDDGGNDGADVPITLRRKRKKPQEEEEEEEEDELDGVELGGINSEGEAKKKKIAEEKANEKKEQAKRKRLADMRDKNRVSCHR